MKYKFSALMAASLLGLSALPAHAQLFDRMEGVESKPATQSPEPQGSVSATPAAQNNQTAPAVKDSQETAATLANYIDGTKTLRGKFEQIVFSNRGEEVSSGTFSLKRPGMFDWQYQEPAEQRIISNGDKVYHYDHDLEQITIRPRSELAGDVAMNLLVGDKKLQQSFNISIQPRDKAPARLRNNEPGLTFYRLEPKGNSDEIDQVWVVMNGQNIAAVYVDTGVGQQSLIVLRNIQRNGNISNKDFDFVPPKGVDVIGG